MYFWERERKRERKHEWGRDRERGKERIPSRLHTVSAEPDVGLQLTNLRDHDLSRNQGLDAQPTKPPRCPRPWYLSWKSFSPPFLGNNAFYDKQFPLLFPIKLLMHLSSCTCLSAAFLLLPFITGIPKHHTRARTTGWMNNRRTVSMTWTQRTM